MTATINNPSALSPAQSRQLLGALFALVFGVVLFVCVTAPALFHLLLMTGRRYEALTSLRNIPFETFLARYVVICFVIGLIPLARLIKTYWRAAFGLVQMERWGQAMWVGWRFGVLSVAAILFVAWAFGAYTWEPVSTTRLIGRLVVYGIGSFLIGVIEEVFFRGALFGALRQVIRWVPAAIATSVFFAAMHFISPEHPAGIAHAHWYSGFALLPHIFFRTSDLSHYWPFAINLFLVGLILCALYQRHGHVYYLIGLHAGWVIAMQAGRLLFELQPGLDSWFWGTSTNVARSWLATMMLSLMAVIACRISWKGVFSGGIK